MSKHGHVIWDFKANTEPVVVPPDKQMHFRCLHCGQSLMVALPLDGGGLSLTMTAKIAHQFTSEHRRCKPTKG